MGKKKRRHKKSERGLGRGVPVPLAPPGATLNRVPFQIKQAADVGTTNRVVARLQLQMFALVDALGLPKALRDGILEHTFVGSQWFIRAEKNKNEYVRLSDKFIRKAAEGSGVRFQGTTMPTVLEPLHLGDHYQLFLISLTIGLRLFFKATGMILTGQATGWHDLKTAVEQAFPQGHPLRLLIDRHGGWSKTLFEDRGDIEHDPYMFTGFRVGPDKDRRPILFQPVGVDGRPLEVVMEGYFRDGFVFAEELVVLAIKSRLPAGRQLVEIPEPQRDPRAPIRFRTT